MYVVEDKAKPAAAEQPRFVQSKWETVNPEDVEAQAMTISKWEQLEKENVDGEPMDEPTPACHELINI